MTFNYQLINLPHYPILTLLCLLLALPGGKQSPASSGAAAPSPDLEAVLAQMDRAAAGVKTVQADLEWDNYQKVVDETEKQKGRVYFHRSGDSKNSNDDVELMFDITEPDAKQVLFKSGNLMLYNPRIDQVTEYEPGKNKADVQSFLSLGFGVRGHDLLQSYDVAMNGWETLDGVRTARLNLVAKSPKVRSMFSQFVLWIDPQRDVPIRQQVMEPSGDYWLSHYTGFNLRAKIPGDIFRIKTTAHTKVVKPQ